MPLGPSYSDLHETITAHWRAGLMGSRAKRRSHWTTKVAYYRAACEALAAAQDRPFTWHEVVGAVRPRGSTSTFYDVAGRHARHRLVDAYHDAGDANSLQIALDYHRTRAIDHLVDEAKVWSYWEYREAYLRTYRDAEHLPIEGYQETVAAWASVNRPLAAALDFAPPMCAVEDLVALHRGDLAALRAQRWLTDVVREAVRRPDVPDPAEATAPGELAARNHDRDSGPRLLPAPLRSTELDDAADPTRARTPLLA